MSQIVLHVLVFIAGCCIGLLANRVSQIWTANEPRRHLAWTAAYVVLVGLGFNLLIAKLGSQLEVIPATILLCILAIIVRTDLSQLIIPNKIVAAGVILALGARVFIHPLPFWNYIIAAFLGSGFLLAVGLLGQWILKKEAMGGGDIKLYVFLGLVLGIQLTLLSIFVASVIGLIGSILVVISGAQERGKVIPFGPYIAVGAWITYLWGDGWIQAYLGLF